MRSVSLAVCGYGLVGQRHVSAALDVPQVNISAVVEPHPDNKAVAERNGLSIYNSLAALFEREAVDGVIIATPTRLHLDNARSALLRDCPILIEKPVATTAEEAEDIVALSRQRGTPVLVGHHRRHNPLIKKAQEIIASGQIGPVRAVNATCWFHKPDHYFDAAPWRKEPGAGPISVNLAHDIDLIRHLCGEVVQVSAHATPSVRGFANEDVAAAVMTLDNSAIATISVSDSVVSPWSWELTSGEYPVYPKTDQSCYLIGGSAGALSVPDLRVWTHENGQRDWWTPIEGVVQEYTPSDPLVIQIAHFRDVIRGEAEPLVSAEEGRRTLRVLEAIQKSAARMAPVDLREVGAA